MSKTFGKVHPAGDKQDRPGTLPDPTIGTRDMKQYGYSWDGMLPLREATAAVFFEKGEVAVFLLYEDGSESMADSADDIKRHADRGGIMGVHREEWNAFLQKQAQREKPSIRAQLAQDAERTAAKKTPARVRRQEPASAAQL